MTVQRTKSWPVPPPAKSGDATSEYLNSLYRALVENSSEGLQDFDILKLANVPYIDVRKYTSFSAAIDAIGSTEATLLIPNEQAAAANKVVPDNVTLFPTQGGCLNIADGVTVTINGHVEAGLYQIFKWTGTGKVAFGRGAVKEVYPEWWGAKNNSNSSTAIQAARTSLTGIGGKISLPNAKYIIDSSITGGVGDFTIQGSNRYSTQLCAHGDLIDPIFNLINCNHLTFKDFQIIGNGKTGNHGMVMENVARSYFENIQIWNVDSGIILNGGTGDNDFHHTRVQGCAGYGVLFQEGEGASPNNQNGFWGLEISHCALESLRFYGLATSNLFSRLNIDYCSGIAIIIFENASEHSADSNIFEGVYIEGGDYESIVLRGDAHGNKFYLGAIGSNAGEDTVGVYHYAINNEFHFGAMDGTAKDGGFYHIRDESNYGNKFFGVKKSWDILSHADDMIWLNVGLEIYADNAAAIAGGLPIGAFYRTGANSDQICVVH